VSCRHARAHGGGRYWGGPHGGERRKMQRGQGVKRRKRKEKIREEERKRSERKKGKITYLFFINCDS
jgi:hypothetical protein